MGEPAISTDVELVAFLDPLAARRAHVDTWARVLEASGLKERSVARRLSAVSSWYQYLVQEGDADHVA
jgi:site-specific recombinase XerC